MNDHVNPVFASLLDYLNRGPSRLQGLENAIVAAKPDFLEAAESILPSMMTALESKDPEAAAELMDAYNELKDKLYELSEKRGEQQ